MWYFFGSQNLETLVSTKIILDMIKENTNWVKRIDKFSVKNLYIRLDENMLIIEYQKQSLLYLSRYTILLSIPIINIDSVLGKVEVLKKTLSLKW